MKNIYLFRSGDKESYAEFSMRMLELCNELKSKHSADGIKVNFTAKPPPVNSIIPYRKSKLAVLSIYYPKYWAAEMIESIQGFKGSYEVEEALPVKYSKKWEDGTTTPGVCLITLFQRRKGLDDSTFINRWYNEHTPLSLRIHPLWNYNRNRVLKLNTEYAEPFDGIVEEQMRQYSDLRNPFKFFGPPLKIIPNMLEVYRHVNTFLKYSSIETYLAEERWIKSQKH